ncbi:sugar phosphate isomerase/epimerase [bacterium]|nr:sugar phosphate isomerase/epimerase [candidate division CSSED10-310 bacterium]
MMNNPQLDITKEIQFAARHGFDFLDLTLEPPAGIPDSNARTPLRNLLSSLGLGCIGHTAYYLPLDSPFDPVRIAATEVIIHHLDIFAELSVPLVTIHSGFSYPHRFFTYSAKLALWVDSLTRIVPAARDRNLTLMLENVPENKDQFRLLRDLFHQFPDVRFHLDIAHANLNVPANVTYNYLKRFKSRLAHVHLSDNFGRTDDLHLPIGAGGIPWGHVLTLLKQAGYDGTMTLEVFSNNREHLLSSREILRSLWKGESE